MTCDEVREVLSEHLLGTLQGEEDTHVSRHLRGCAACRAEMLALTEGLSTFARATHDRPPPSELRDRVLTVLEEEWRDVESSPHWTRRPWSRPLATAAAVLLVVISIGWGVGQGHRASGVAADARSYQAVLGALGGEDFRIGTLRSEGAQQVQGNVVLYDAHTDQSWGLVIVHAPGMTGSAHASLSSASGRTIKLVDLKFDREGDASSWLVSSADLHSFSRLTITTAEGSVLATAQILSA